MKLTILGCNSPYPGLDGACSGYLLEDNDTMLLIDCGHSVFGRLLDTADIAKLDAIVITHFHPDHYVDLYALRHYIKLNTPAGIHHKRPTLFIPTEPQEFFNYWQDVLEFENHTFE